MEIDPTVGYIILKNDAIRENLVEPIEELITVEHQLRIIGGSLIELTLPEVFAIYRPDLPAAQEDTPADIKRMLITVGAVSMQGCNKVLTVEVPDAESHGEMVSRLQAVRGGTNDTPEQRTIRGLFPFPRCEEYDQFTFWERAAYFTQNRAHVPDSTEAMVVVKGLLEAKR